MEETILIIRLSNSRSTKIKRVKLLGQENFEISLKAFIIHRMSSTNLGNN